MESKFDRETIEQLKTLADGYGVYMPKETLAALECGDTAQLGKLIEQLTLITKGYGVDLPPNETLAALERGDMAQLGELIAQARRGGGQCGELTDEELDNVSGGCPPILNIIRCVTTDGDTMRKLTIRFNSPDSELNNLCRKYGVGPDERLPADKIVEVIGYGEG